MMRCLSYYLKWDPQENYYYASNNTGFMPSSERTEDTYSKYSSINDKIDASHYYKTLIKFVIGRATYDATQEIRNNNITREEGVRLVNKYDTKFPAKYFKEFLDCINLTEENFWQIINNFRSPHLLKPDRNDWILKHQVK